jgi:hypothetical protein
MSYAQDRAFRRLLWWGQLAAGLGCKEQLTPLAARTPPPQQPQDRQGATEMRESSCSCRRAECAARAGRSAYDNLRPDRGRSGPNKQGRPRLRPQASEFYSHYQGFLDGRTFLTTSSRRSCG